jgi:transcriptional regulator with XRE-family HTH domain
LPGEFIRSPRERWLPERLPEQAGLPRGWRRRANGLRREEVAALCGIGPTWLTARTQAVSASTLERLAAALALTPPQRADLFDLARLCDPETGTAQGDAHAAPALQATLALALALALAVAAFGSPACVLDRAWDAVAGNTPAAALFDACLGPSTTERNLLRYTFLDRSDRSVIADWPARAGATSASSAPTAAPGCKRRTRASRSRRCARRAPSSTASAPAGRARA